MAKFKKGDKVYNVSSWDDRGGFTIQKLVVMSWGKQQGVVATVNETDEFECVESRVYVNRMFDGKNGKWFMISQDEGYDAAMAQGENMAKIIADARREYLTNEIETCTNNDKWVTKCKNELSQVGAKHIVPELSRATRGMI